ncbi:MAG: DNA-binding response regulator [Solirubrobacterales bacterium]
MSASSTTLLIFGRAPSSEGLANEFILDGYDARSAGGQSELQARCTPGDVDLIVIDGASEQAARLRTLRALRAGELAPPADPNTRVLWLTGRAELMEVLRAFDAGADDVLRAPWAYAELRARTRALLRREVIVVPPVIRYDGLVIETVTLRVTFCSVPLQLRRLEYALLAHLAVDPERVYTRDELLRDVWGYRSQGRTRTLDSHVARLRRKLALAGAHGWVSSIRGVGYRLAPVPHRPQLRVVPPEALSA